MRVCGKNVFRETNPSDIRRVYISDNFHDKEIMDIIRENKIKYFISTSKELDHMMKHNQGIIMDIDEYKYYELKDIEDDETLIVMLDHIEDPHNLGAIIRTCEARGIKSIIIPKDRSAHVNETVMKTSTGALNRVKIIEVVNLATSITKLKDMGYFIYSADMDGTNYKKIDYANKTCIIIGNEGSGISRLVRESSDEIISIPMKGEINSLNASVALAILVYGVELDGDK